MAEEQRYEQSNPQGLCANNCGFFGNPTTLNLCSKCYRDHRLKDRQRQEMESLLASTSSSTASVKPPPTSFAFSSSDPAIESTAKEAIAAGSEIAVAVGPSRCGSCRKRVGLTGFKCRCGTTFCGVHRYAEQHSCTFDFKGLGKEAIARANPVVKAAKLDHKI